MRSQSLNIVGGMIAVAVTGAGAVYLLLLVLSGLSITATTSFVPPVATGVTLAALVFSVYFTDSLLVYMSESYALYQENILRAEKAKNGIGLIGESEESKESRGVEPAVYQEIIPHTRQGKRGEMVIERPLSESELAWGQALIKMLLHAWHADSIKSDKLAGKGRPISQPARWVEMTDILSEMGIVSKSANGTQMLVSYGMAVEQVIPRLRSVSLPSGKPPRIAPPPQADYKKMGIGPHKTENDSNV